MNPSYRLSLLGGGGWGVPPYVKFLATKRLLGGRTSFSFKKSARNWPKTSVCWVKNAVSDFCLYKVGGYPETQKVKTFRSAEFHAQKLSG